MELTLCDILPYLAQLKTSASMRPTANGRILTVWAATTNIGKS